MHNSGMSREKRDNCSQFTIWHLQGREMKKSGSLTNVIIYVVVQLDFLISVQKKCHSRITVRIFSTHPHSLHDLKHKITSNHAFKEPCQWVSYKSWTWRICYYLTDYSSESHTLSIPFWKQMCFNGARLCNHSRNLNAKVNSDFHPQFY